MEILEKALPDYQISSISKLSDADLVKISDIAFKGAGEGAADAERPL
jgi:hypothetical protein